jgi:hypothetical protein
MHTAWVEHASSRVDWQKIAKAFLRRIGEPGSDGVPAPRSRWTVWATPSTID